MSDIFHIVVCGGIVPDPLQTLEPVNGPNGPALRNELQLPHVLDPWAAHALYEAAHLTKKHPGSKVWLVSLAPKAKLQQVMMTVAQRVSFELVAVDGASGGFTDSAEVAAALAAAIEAIPGSIIRDCCCSADGNRHRALPAPLCRWPGSGWASPSSSRASMN
jgi:electron transfer flavoprotein beta subunit